MVLCNDGSSDEDAGSGLDCASTGSKGGESDELEELTGNGHKSHGGCGMAIAKGIYGSRHFFLIAWPVAALIMAPFGYVLVLNAAPCPKSPPHGTGSALAQEYFESKFPYLVGMKMEMAVIKCRTHCDSAVSVMSQTHVQTLKDMVEQFGHAYPGTIIDVRSYYTFGTKIDNNPMISFDKQSVLLVWSWRVNGTMKLQAQAFAKQLGEKVDALNVMQGQGPGTYDIAVTGPTFLNLAMKETLIHEVPIHEISTLWLPFGILAMRLKSVRLLMLVLCSMPLSILVSFGFMYFVSLHTTVIMYSLMMMLLLCTALSFDYSLFTLTRFGEERRNGAEMKDAILTVITQSGHVVVVSGLVLTIAYGAMLVLPGAFKSFCIAACSMILCSLGVQMTFVPCALAVFPWLGGGFEPDPNMLQNDSEAFYSVSGTDPDSLSKVMIEEDGKVRPDRDHIWMRVQPFRHGIYYDLGGKLTQSPLNVLVPLLIYLVTSPLTYRMCSYKMGHAYELQIPRGRKEWETSLQIQQNFPTSAGNMMPTLIIATNRLPADPPPMSTLPEVGDALLPFMQNVTQNVTQQGSDGLAKLSTTSTEPPVPLDVRGQAFFESNCNMVNTLIQAMSNKSYALHSEDFQSPTFYGEHPNGDVKCLDYKLTHFYRTNLLTTKFMFTSSLMQKLWDQLVSHKHDAMLTLLTPKMDPFSAEAFSMTTDIRNLLHNATTYTAHAGYGDITYMMFSPSAIMMDMIMVTNQRLPIAFLGCALVCFFLIAVAFGAALIPFKLIFTVIMPITWAYGAALFVYEDGALEWIGFPGLSPTYITGSGPAGVDWTVPMFTLTIMLGLALDYDVFLFERVYEFRHEGFGDCESIQLALSATGPTISAAGMIFAFTFVSMLLGSMAINNQMGFIFVFSIVVDTFVVRTVLVPAMLSLNPCLNYWPSKMPDVKYAWLKKEGD